MLTSDTHLQTWLSYSSQKSCVKIWFGLVEPFKSYCVHKHTKKNKRIKKKKSKAARLWCSQRRLTIIESIWKFGNLPYLVANTYGLNFIKFGGIWFFRGQKLLLGGLTVNERSWDYGNLPNLVANEYGLNFIKIRGICIFRGGGWETPY